MFATLRASGMRTAMRGVRRFSSEAAEEVPESARRPDFGDIAFVGTIYAGGLLWLYRESVEKAGETISVPKAKLDAITHELAEIKKMLAQ
ncbi:hypothetical protein T492DRAFT_890565 [Pavlovales sp. CCMP2436]|nr:hypothetical protein T492DRAFT_890565 [Pavlovales sp. CCMP2436]